MSFSVMRENRSLDRARYRRRHIVLLVLLDVHVAVVVNVILETLRDTTALVAVRVAVGAARRRRGVS